MGLHDRDYYRNPPSRGGFGHFDAWSATTWLIVLNIAVFVLDGLLRRANARAYLDPELLSQTDPEVFRQWLMFGRMGPLERSGFFSTDSALYHGQVWRFLTFQFLHASPMHLIGNLLAMYFFGPIVEAHFGPRRYLAFYLLCGLSGAACYLLLSMGGVFPGGPQTPLVGASAGIFGLLVAAAMIAPDVEIWVYFAIPVTVRTLAIIGMGLAAYTVFAAGPFAHNAGGEAAHLGGGVLGFVLMKNQHWLNGFAPGRPRLTAGGRVSSARGRRPRAFQKDWSKDLNR
jgi:membrane associated rhomboid family serine protease